MHTFILQRPHPAATELISAHDNGGKMTSIPVTCYRRQVDGRSGGVDHGYVVLISSMSRGAARCSRLSEPILQYDINY